MTVPSSRSVPSGLPVVSGRRRSRGCRRRSGTRGRARRELAQTHVSSSGRPPRRAPSVAAAANSRPVLSRQRSRYCSGVVGGVPGLLALEDLAAGQRQAGLGEHRDRLHVARRHELGERPGEEVVARRPRDAAGRASATPSAGRAGAGRRRSGRRGRASPCGRARPRSRRRPGPGARGPDGRRAQVHQHRPQPLAARARASRRPRRPPAAVAGHRLAQPLLDRVQVGRRRPGPRARAATVLMPAPYPTWSGDGAAREPAVAHPIEAGRRA